MAVVAVVDASGACGVSSYATAVDYTGGGCGERSQGCICWDITAILASSSDFVCSFIYVFQ